MSKQLTSQSIAGYEWRDGARLSQESAPRFGAARIALRQKLGLNPNEPDNPEAIVGDAKLKSSGFHEFFDWNDKRVAHEQRVTRARYLLRHFVIVYVIPTNLHVPGGARKIIRQLRSGNGAQSSDSRVVQQEQDAVSTHMHFVRDGYYTEVQIFGDEELLEAFEKQCLAELSAWREKYQRLQKFKALFEAIDELQIRLKLEKSAADRRGARP